MRCERRDNHPIKDSLHNFLLTSNGRSEAPHIQAEEARPQYSQEGSGDRAARVPALPEHEAPASRLRGVRVLRR
jgi:hypothetical protein